MKIEKLRLKNWVKFEDFEIIFNDGITNLIGMNGDGKTTIGCTALWAGFKGIAERSSTGQLIGERFRFITEGKKSLDVEITLRDEKTHRVYVLKRHITKTTNGIKISQENGQSVSREYVEDLFNVSFLSANHFCSLTGVEQAAAMGIDTSTYDKDLKEKKEQAQGYRRDIKRLGDLVPVDKCEVTDIKELYEKQTKATTHNSEVVRLTALLSTWKDKIEDLDDDLYKADLNFNVIKKAHEENMAALNEKRIEASTTIKEFVTIEEPIDLEPIGEEIKGIVEANKAFYLYELYIKDLEEKEEVEGYLNDNILRQKDIGVDRRNYLQSKTFGIKNLVVDEKGQLTKDGKYIRLPYFSQGELEVLVARIGMNLNPELKVRFIDNFDLLDDDNQYKLLTHLTKKGFQIITATVGNKIKADNSVLLKDCKIIDSNSEQPTIYSNSDDPDNMEFDYDEEEVVKEAEVKEVDPRQEVFDGTSKTVEEVKPPVPAETEAVNHDDDEF